MSYDPGTVGLVYRVCILGPLGLVMIVMRVARKGSLVATVGVLAAFLAALNIFHVATRNYSPRSAVTAQIAAVHLPSGSRSDGQDARVDLNVEGNDASVTLHFDPTQDEFLLGQRVDVTYTDWDARIRTINSGGGLHAPVLHSESDQTFLMNNFVLVGSLLAAVFCFAYARYGRSDTED